MTRANATTPHSAPVDNGLLDAAKVDGWLGELRAADVDGRFFGDVVTRSLLFGAKYAASARTTLPLERL